LARKRSVTPKPVRVGVLLLPQFPMMAFSAVIEPLRVANILCPEADYRWLTVTTSGLSVRSSSGLTVATDFNVADGPDVDWLVVCSGGNADRYVSPAAHSWMRAQERKGAMIGAVADGAFFLARAGLLDNCTSTLHWQSQAAFREKFPKLKIVSDLYVIDRSRFTSAGGVAAFDMMLELIERRHGRAVAGGIAEWFVHSRIRMDADRELLSVKLRTGVADQRVLSAISLMERRLEGPLAIDDIAKRLDLSTDTLGRLFVAHTGMPPATYYRRLRLRRGQGLLAHSTMRIGEIAVACGFENPSGFARAYRDLFGRSPREQRRALRRSESPGR
jgi:transcriptional regulator GlxA family with amidase domain